MLTLNFSRYVAKAKAAKTANELQDSYNFTLKLYQYTAIEI